MYCTNDDCPDYKATGVHGEYRDDITVCPYCGQPLQPAPATGPMPDVPAAPPRSSYEPPAADDAHDDLEPVYETSDPTEIPVVRSFLDAQGIPHVVVGEERFGAFRGSLSPFRFNPRAGVAAFLVPSPYAEIARDLLAEIEDLSTSDD
jgi:hypothetical protein